MSLHPWNSYDLFLLIKKPSFLKRKCTSKKPGNIISRKKTTSRALGIGNRNRNTNAADTCRIQRRNNIFHHVRSHIVSPFCLKKCLAKKRQDKRAASRCKLLFYLSYNITEQISCQPNIAKMNSSTRRFYNPGSQSFISCRSILSACFSIRDT